MNNENKLINGNEKLAPKFTIGTANINPNDDKLAETKEKPKRKINNTDLGPDFVAPDGGWGWLVVVAAGTANVSIEAEPKWEISRFLILIRSLNAKGNECECQCNAKGRATLKLVLHFELNLLENKNRSIDLAYTIKDNRFSSLQNEIETLSMNIHDNFLF